MAIYKFPTHDDLEEFAEHYLGVDYDDFYELYYQLLDEDQAELDELNSVQYEF